jgi:hypothetical protein
MARNLSGELASTPSSVILMVAVVDSKTALRYAWVFSE